MRRIAFIIIFFLFNVSIFARGQSSLDSLKSLLNNNISDTLRYQVLKSLCRFSYDDDVSQAIKYGDEAIKLAEAIALKPDVKFYDLMIYLNDHSGHYDQSILYLEKLIKSLSSRSAKGDELQLLKYNGWLQLRKGEFREAEKLFLKVLDNTIENALPDERNRAYYNLALVYERIGDQEKRINYYHKYLDHADWDIKKKYVSLVFFKLGEIYFDDKKYEESLDNYFKSLDLAYEAKDSCQIISTLNRIAWNYYVMAKLDESLDYYKENVKISSEMNKQPYLANCYGNMGNIYRDREDYNKAIEYYDKSISISQKIGDIYNLSWLYKDISQMYVILGDYLMAYENYKLHTKYQDSLMSDDYQKRLLEARTRYENEKKEQELELLRVKLQNNNYLIYGLGGGIILFLMIAGLFFMQARLKARQRIAAMNHHISELTQKNLRQQMNPHFIFNTLNSIQYYVFKNDRISSNNYMTKFAKLIRNTLENSRYTSIPIKEEIEALNLYLELESLRFKGKFDWKINIDEEIDTLLYKIPTMLIQPFVENSIGHGLMHKESKGFVSVDLKLNNGTMVCTIEDNGIGRKKAMEIKKQKNNAHNSLGTTITESRLSLVNSLYGKNMKVIYTDLKDEKGNPSGTRVEITIPVMG